VLQQELINLSGYQSGLDSIYEEIRDKISKDANALIDTSIDSITAFSVSLQNLMKKKWTKKRDRPENQTALFLGATNQFQKNVTTNSSIR
jgi:hypothetical protein